MPEPLALVGAGMIGKRHLKAISETDAAQLVAIVDPMPNAAALAQEANVPHFEFAEDMLAATSPKGVIVATPTEHHLQPSLCALEAGCHLLVEKPITATLEEADAVIYASETRGLHVLVGHHRRYYPQVAAARDLVRGGTLGQLVTVSGQWSVRKPDPYYEPDWRKGWRAGPVLTNLIHEMDYMRFIVGEVEAVTALAGNPVQGFEKEDVTALALRFENGALGSFILSDQADSPWAWEMATGENPAFPKNGQNCLTFAGTKGALEFPNLRHWTSDGLESWVTPKTARDMPFELGDAFVHQIEHFAELVRGDTAPRITAREATDTLKATLAVLQSAAEGRHINLRENA